MIILISFIVIWIISGILTYGISLAYMQREYPSIAEEMYLEDVVFAMFFSILGPMSLLISFILSNYGKYGLMYRRKQ